MKVVITMSGGKDSEASAIWAKEKYGTENCVTVFCDVGWEAPETYEFIDYLVGKLGMEHFTLKSSKYDGMIDLAIKKQRFPSTTARFCTQELKVKPVIEDVNFKFLQENLEVQDLVKEIKEKQTISVSEFRLLTGACKMGCESFMKQNNLTETTYPLTKALDLLKNQFGWSKIQEHFN